MYGFNIMMYNFAVSLWSSPPRSFEAGDGFVEFDTPDYDSDPLKTTEDNVDYRCKRRPHFIENYEEGLSEERAAPSQAVLPNNDVISWCTMQYVTEKVVTIRFLSGDEEWDDGILAQVLAESRNTYLDELKRNSKRRTGSPGPSTST